MWLRTFGFLKFEWLPLSIQLLMPYLWAVTDSIRHSFQINDNDSIVTDKLYYIVVDSDSSDKLISLIPFKEGTTRVCCARSAEFKEREDPSLSLSLIIYYASNLGLNSLNVMPDLIIVRWAVTGVKIGSRKLFHPRFADSILLIASTIKRAERMPADFDHVCGKVGLQPNLTKTMFLKNEQVPDVLWALSGANALS